jgi:integrase
LTRRGNGEGSVQQRTDGRWCGIATVAGKRRFVYGRTRQGALRKLRELQAAVARGAPVAGERLTVGAYLDDWLGRIDVRPRTLTAYKCLVRVHVQPAIGSHRLVRLEPRHLERLYADVINSGRSKRTAQYIHSVLHRALGQAARQGLVARNVADFVERPRVERHEVTVLDLGQARQFEKAAGEDPNEGLYVLAITTGMRQSELLGLRWRDVDLHRGYLSVTNTLVKPGRCPVFGPPKTRKSRRRINLTDKAIKALQRLRARQAKCRLKAGGGKWAEFDLVFTNRCGGPMDGTNLTERGFRRLLTRAGLPRIRFHDLRHTAATLLLIKGVHPKVVADMLGHSSVAVTLDVYSHVLEGLQEEAVAALNEVFA